MHTPVSHTPLPYRPDIDGLRAIAVLAVVVFHFSPVRLPGGFVGVDIFFVISGFLISSIIMGGLERGDFSYWDFYARRIRRIFPALILMLVTTLLLGSWLLLPDEYEELSRQAIAGALFSYNFLLTGETGYFDAVAEQKPLLHLWSLGIEEQFYILWPLLLAAMWRLRARRLTVIAALAVASFILNVMLVDRYPAATFYLPFTRFWELLAGCLLAAASLRGDPVTFMALGKELSSRQMSAIRNVLSLAGMSLALGAILLYQNDVVYPGWRAAVPVLGAALIIAAGPAACFNKYVLSSTAAVFIGLISYPLYLWHWPALLWAGRIETRLGLAQSMQGVTEVIHFPAIKIIALGVAFLLAWATYRFIEKRVRAFGHLGGSALVLLVSLAICLPAAALFQNVLLKSQEDDPARNAFLKRFDLNSPDSDFRRKIMAAYRFDCSFYGGDGQVRSSLPESCYRVSARPVVMLWGDSHAQHLRPGLDAILQPPGAAGASAQLIQITSASCTPRFQPITSNNNGAKACNLSNALALKTVSEVKPDILIIAQANDYFKTDWAGLVAEARNLGALRVIVVGPVPRWQEDLPRLLAYRYWPDVPVRLNTQLRREYFDIDRKLQQQLAGVPEASYVSATDFFCDAAGCLVSVGNDRLMLTTYDTGHLTLAASGIFVANRLGPLISPAIARRTVH